MAELDGIEKRSRETMNDVVKAKGNRPFKEIIGEEIDKLDNIDPTARGEFMEILNKLPLAYNKVPAIFKSTKSASVR